LLHVQDLRKQAAEFQQQRARVATPEQFRRLRTKLRLQDLSRRSFDDLES
jgi:hypothetical protein